MSYVLNGYKYHNVMSRLIYNLKCSILKHDLVELVVDSCLFNGMFTKTKLFRCQNVIALLVYQ